MLRTLRPRTSLVAALAIAGALLAIALPRLALPFGRPTEGPRLLVRAEAAASPAAALLDAVALPLERRLAALPGVERVETRIDDGRVEVEAQGEAGLDPDAFQLAALRRTDSLALPLDHLAVFLLPERRPVVSVAVLRGGSAARRAIFARDILLPELSRCRGAGRSELLGAHPLRLAVAPRAADLAAHNLTPLDLLARLRGVGAVLPAGRVRDGGSVRPLALRERVASLEALGAIEIRPAIQGDGGGTPLREVAILRPRQVEDGSWFRWRGEEGVLVRVFRAPGGNAATLADEVGARVERLRSTARVAGFELALLPDPEDPSKGGASLALRFDLLGNRGNFADIAPEAVRRRGAALEAALLGSLRELHAKPLYSFYRRRSGDAGSAAAGTAGGTDFGDPDRDGEAGELVFELPGPAEALEARRRLGRRLAATPDLLARFADAVPLVVEISAPPSGVDGALAALADRARAALARAPALCQACLVLEPAALRRDALQLTWNDAVMRPLGRDPAALGEQIRAGLGDLLAGEVEIAGVEPEVLLLPVDAADLANLPLRPSGAGAGGGTVPLRALARIERRPQPPTLLWIDGRPALRFRLLAPAGIDPKALASRLGQVHLAPGERIEVRHLGAGEEIVEGAE